MKNSFFFFNKCFRNVFIPRLLPFLDYKIVLLTTLSIRCIACQIVLVRLTRFFHFEQKNFLKRSSHKERKSLLTKNKKPHGKRESLTRQKKSPVKRTRLTGKEIVSCQNKMCHNKTRKKLKTLVIIKTIYEVFPLRKQFFITLSKCLNQRKVISETMR